MITQSNIGNEEQQSYAPYDPLKTELHTLVDKLQLETPPSEQPRRPLWQRVVMWAVPVWLITFCVVLCYNARVDTCAGAKVKYRGNVLCINSEQDYLLMAESYETEILSRDTSKPTAIDGLNEKRLNDLENSIAAKYGDKSAQNKAIKARLTYLNALRSYGLDSVSYCGNLAIGYYNVAINHLNRGNRDSACLTYQILNEWHWKDSVLTKTELAVLSQICDYQLLIPFKNNEKYSYNNDNEKYGYKNEKGEIIIPATYDDAHVFLEDLAAVKVGKRWGFINSANKMVIEPQFGYAYGFEEGMALISDAKNLYGYINPSGELVIPPQYEMAERFKQGVAKVKLKKESKIWVCIDKAGKVVDCGAKNAYNNTLTPPQYKKPISQAKSF